MVKSYGFNKKIAGSIRPIPFEDESEGILRLVQILPDLLGMNGNYVIAVDEIDRSLQPLLLINILKCILKDDKAMKSDGQLIVTTHNPISLTRRGEDLRDFVYFILKNDKGQKKIKDLNSFEARTYKQNNVMESYFGGEKYTCEDYSSLPEIGSIEFKEIDRLIQEGFAIYENRDKNSKQDEK